MSYKRVKHLSTIRKIPDELWNEIKIILPSEKPNNTIGRPLKNKKEEIIIDNQGKPIEKEIPSPGMRKAFSSPLPAGS